MGGRRGGARGGRFGARLTRPQTAAATVEVAGDPDAVRQRARAAMDGGGRLVHDPNRAGDGSVWGLVGSGAMNMMPALVRVNIREAAPGRSLVEVRATGREGLIKQRIGAKAADAIAQAISRP